MAQMALWAGMAVRAAVTMPEVSPKVTIDRENSRRLCSTWKKKSVEQEEETNIFVDVVVCIHIGGPADKTFVEDDPGHETEVGNESVDGIEEEETHVDDLEGYSI